MNHTKSIVITGLLTALGVLLPIALHGVPNAGSILLPMHVPVLLCGLICGPVFGLACGLLTPFLSHIFTQMPPAAVLPAMLFELAAYGLLAGVFKRYVVKTRHMSIDVIGSLLSAMLLGRLAYGAANALFFKAGSYSLQLWITAAFVKALPGIAIQIVLVPALYFALLKARLIGEK